jgi:hypothetical protein
MTTRGTTPSDNLHLLIQTGGKVFLCPRQIGPR